MLQQDRQLKAIASSIEKKIKRELLKLMKDDREKYEKFFESFGLQLKYGVVNDFGANKEMLRDLLIFRTSESEKPITLAEYEERMKSEQKYVYYACGESVAKIAALPQTEYVREKGYEVLYLTDEVDEFVMQMLHDVNGKEIKSVNDDIADESEKEQAEKSEEENKELFDFMKETLGSEVVKIKISNKLKNHPVFLTSEGGITLEMEKYFAKMKTEQVMKAQKVLELNGEHKMFKALQEAFANDREKAAKLTKLLYSQALLIAGFSLENPTEYTDLVCSLVTE